MTVEQFVMAYGAEQDRLRALLPEGCDVKAGVLQVNGFLNGSHSLSLKFTTADGTAYRFAYDCDADTLMEYST